MEQDLQFQPRGPGLDVSQVEDDHLVEGALAATADLPQPGQPRLDPEPLPRPGVVQLGLPGKRRTGADEAHVAPQDIPQLRQLVDAQPPEPAADAGDPGIGDELEHAARPLRPALDEGLDVGLVDEVVAVAPHRPQLVELELPAPGTQPDLREDGRSARAGSGQA